MPTPPTGADAQGVERAFDILWRAVHVVNRVVRETERLQGITEAQLVILSHLHHAPSLSLCELAERTLTHASTVSKVVRGLVERALVMKVHALDDARRVELTLTPEGLKVFREARASLRVPVSSALSQLGPADRDALVHGLHELIGAFRAAGITPAVSSISAGQVDSGPTA